MCVRREIRYKVSCCHSCSVCVREVGRSPVLSSSALQPRVPSDGEQQWGFGQLASVCSDLRTGLRSSAQALDSGARLWSWAPQ